MILERFLERLYIRSYFAKLIIGSALAALAISLTSVIKLYMLGFSVITLSPPYLQRLDLPHMLPECENEL